VTSQTSGENDLGADEQRLRDKFLTDVNYFYGPDPEIMETHDISARSDREEEVLGNSYDAELLSLARSRLQAGMNESFEVMEQMGAAPGAKWGDLIAGLFTASGDLAMSSLGGVSIFSSLCHHPIRYIRKYWENDATVGVREGDVFLFNDSRYGNVHNTDQGIVIPIYHDGELIAWAGTTVHEGENGSNEPGGMPIMAESPYDEGLKMSPFKVGENYELRRDIVTFLQNSVREPKLQLADMKAKMYACLRVKQRVEEVVAEFGVEPLIASMRSGLEDTKQEAKRRISEWPDSTTRCVIVADSTLRENIGVKIQLAVTKSGDDLTFDFRGSSPEFLNRSNNTVQSSLKGMVAQLFLTFVWPDLPRNQGVFAPTKFVLDDHSVLNSSYDVPNAQSMQTFFQAFVASWVCVQKLQYGAKNRYTNVIAPWYSNLNMFVFGGVTQHGEFVGNLCADVNLMGGGARNDSDGEGAMAPFFGCYTDGGEQELFEQELPFLQIVSRQFQVDNVSFGKYRGGVGYEMMLASKDSDMWGFMSCATGAKIPTVPGLFGGYGCPTYPLCKVKGVDVYETLKNDPDSFHYTIEDIMNKRPWPEASYTTHDKGMPFELAQRGELYMMSQGSGGGYGDVLERDPALVLKDLQNGIVSEATARDIFKVVVDPKMNIVDEEATEAAREAERQARRQRGVPFDEFVSEWTSERPPEHLPWYGSWGDRSVIYAGGYAGAPHEQMSSDALHPIVVPNPKDVEIASLTAQLAEARDALKAYRSDK
jgi:N-methylhydantoinase B/oxoprolinase/acetone carboxylase alpha subunit